MTAPFTFGITPETDPTRKPQDPAPLVPQPTKTAPLTAPFSFTPSPEAEPLRQSARLGVQQPPERAARVLDLTQRLGMPAAFVDRNLDALEQETKRQGFDADRFRQTSPLVAKWLAENPTHFAAAQDDLDQLAAIEGTLAALGKAWTGGLASGRATVRAGRLAYQKMLQGGTLDADEQKTLDRYQAESRGPTGGGFLLGGVLRGGATVIGQMFEDKERIAEPTTLGFMVGGMVGSVLGPGGALGGAALGTSVGSLFGTYQSTSVTEAGHTYEALSEIRGENGETIDEDTKRNVALSVGFLNGMLETASFGVLAAPYKKAAEKFLREASRDVLVRPTLRKALAEAGKTYAAAIASETGTEVLQEISGVVGEELAKVVTHGQFATVMNDPEQRELLMERLVGIAQETATSMLLVGAPGASINLAQDVVRARRANANAEKVAELVRLRSESKTAQRAPQAVDGIVEAATQGTPLEYAHLDVEAFTEYYQQQGTDPRQAARELWGDTQAYDEAVQTGGTMALPMARFLDVAAKSTDVQFFVNEWRAAPDALNKREADVLLKTAQEQAAQEPAQTTDVQPAYTEALDRITTQLQATGRYRAADIGPMAEQAARVFTRLGERVGLTPVQVMERFGLTITDGTVKPEAVDEVAAAERDALANEPAPDPYIVPESERDPKMKTKSGEWVYARTAGGDLRTKLNKVSTEGLIVELLKSYEANSEDAGTAAGELKQDENFHWSEDGRSRMFGNKYSMYAAGAMASRDKTVAKLEAEFKRRGMTEEQVSTLMAMRVFGASLDAETVAGLDDVVRDAAGNVLFQRPESPAFQRWFGDSKVVDEQGNARIVYHGTNQEVEIFRDDRVIWAALDPKKASQYAEGRGTGAPNVMPVYMRVEKPLRISRDMNDQVTWQEFLDATGLDIPRPEALAYRDEYDALYPDNPQRSPLYGYIRHYPAVLAAIQEAGYDGIMARERGVETVGAFDPRQIKSATGNNGTYDPSNPSILFQGGTATLEEHSSFDLPLLGMPDLPLHRLAIATPSGRVIVDAYDHGAGNPLEVALIYLEGQDPANKLGVGLVREVGAILKQEFPEATGVVGRRVSGASVKAGVRDRQAEYFQSVDEYGGEHRPPGAEDGAPGHDLAKVYPDDVYSANGPRYYGTGEDAMDASSFAIAHRLRGKPNATVTIYRAIPDDLTTAEKIAKIEKQKAHILRRGTLPPNVDTGESPSRFYERISDELDRLKALPVTEEEAPTIGAGDWVTINRQYAKDHGEGALRGHYKIISKKVKASEIFTNGDSIHEWGYWPKGSEAEYEQAAPLGPRGSLKIAADRQLTINLFESADLSTFLHESAHAYLEVLRDLSGESEALATDARTILDFLGVQRFSDIGREQHETFARAWEAYLMEGKAPTIGLRRAFYRFRLWLTAKYHQVQGLDVTLTPEIRDVFDRMLASEAEIDAAQNEAQVVPLFTTAEAAGMSEAEFALYRETVEDAHERSVSALTTRLLKEAQREREAWWKEESAAVRAEVAAEVNAQPVYQVLAYLQRGELPSGEVDPDAVKLSKDELVARKGKDFLKRLPRPYVYSREGGVPVDVLAEQYGFTSGDEMLLAIAAAPKAEGVIEQETQRRMHERHGDMLRDGSVADAAEEAVMGEWREKLIRDELKALNKKVREVGPFVRQARQEQAQQQRAKRDEGQAILRGVPDESLMRQIAFTLIGGQRVRDIQPYRYWVAARKASKAAQDAIAKQDFVAAANAKQAELQNLANYREAQRVLAEVEKVAAYAKRLQKPSMQQRIGKAGHDYLEQINGILERFDFRALSNKAADRRQALAQFITQQEKAGVVVTVPDDLVDEAFRQPWRTLTPDQLFGIRDTLQHLHHLVSLKNKLLANEAARTLEEAVALAVSTIEANAKRTLPRDLETHTVGGGGFKRRLDAYIASHRKLANMLRVMDGLEDGGPLWSLLMRPINAASDRHVQLSAQMNQQLSAVFDQFYTKQDRLTMYTRELVSAGGFHGSLSKMGRLMVALNWGAEDNRVKLREGLSITTSREVTDAEVEAIIDTLDQKDMEFVQAVWDLLDSYWPDMKALAERIDGLAPEKIEAVPVRTRHGEYRGGYFPLVYDREQSNRGEKAATEQLVSEVRGATTRNTTKAGSRNARTAVTGEPIKLDFTVIFSHLEAVAMDLAFTEVLYDANRIIRHPEVGSAIRDHYGNEQYKAIKSAIDAIAVGDETAKNGMEAAAAWLRSGVSVATMGWSLSTAALQPLGLAQSIVRIGPKWVGRGMRRWLTSARGMEDSIAWIQEKSPFMASRSSTMMREISEIRTSIGMGRGKAGLWTDAMLAKATRQRLDLQDVQDSYFWLITRMQLVADVPTWLGAYEKALESGTDDATAVALADQAVLDSQGGGQIKDMAAVQRGSPLFKIWTTFYGYFNTTLNLLHDQVAQGESKGRMAVDVLMLTVVPATMTYLLRAALKGDMGDDEWWEQLPEQLARENLNSFLGLFVLVRELSSAVAGFSGYSGPAGARAYSDATKLIAQVAQGELDEGLWRSLNSTAGILFHYPALQVERLVRGLVALSEGRTNNPLAPLFGPPRR